jgi:hypothetical protein
MASSVICTNPVSRGTYMPPRQAWNQGSGRNSPTASAPSRAAELPSHRGSPAPQQPTPGGGEYYEDVDPRFAEPAVPRPTPPLQTTNAYEDIPDGARSPAESDQSTFTSISQRGINPRWNPAPPPPSMPTSYGGNVIPRRPVNRPTDVLLNSNPDFQLPSRSSPGGGGAYPTRPL